MIDIDKALLVFEKKDPDVMIIAHQYKFRENSGNFVHWYEDSRSGNQTERKSGNEA